MARPRKQPVEASIVPNPFHNPSGDALINAVQPLQTQVVSKAAVASNPMEQPDRFKLSAIGFSGLQMFDGITTDEIHKELQWPYSAKTFKKMTYNTAINSSLTLYENLISKVNWRVVPPQEATEEEKNQTKFINECLEDMDTPFRQVIKDCLSSNVYGFAVLEKVFRRRNKNSGSIYSDNKIALKKLALRNAESIEKFIFDEEGNEILGVKQTIVGGNYSRYVARAGTQVVIPRSKLMHVVTGRNYGDPYGKSPLRDVYVAWRYMEVLSELEAVSVQKDLSGIPVIKIPASYLSADASPEQKAIYQNFCNMGRNLQVGSQTVVVLPSNVDEATRTPLFDVSLLSNEGGKKNFDLNEIKNFYQNQIYTGLSSDVLILGSNGVGSFALGQIKNSLTGSAVESMLDNIVDSFNRDVIRHLYELNGFDVTRACKLDYENLHSTDLETTSKYYQRIASVGLIEKDRAVLNAVRTSIGIDALPDDLPPQEDLLTGNSSRAGDGFTSPGSGTSTEVTGTDTSSDNLDNTA